MAGLLLWVVAAIMVLWKQLVGDSNPYQYIVPSISKTAIKHRIIG